MNHEKGKVWETVALETLSSLLPRVSLDFLWDVCPSPLSPPLNGRAQGFVNPISLPPTVPRGTQERCHDAEIRVSLGYFHENTRQAVEPHKVIVRKLPVN